MDYLIAGAGEYLLEKDFLLNILKGRTLIALDGAANTLYSMEVNPHIILGDLDSIQPSILQHYENLGIPIVYTPDQNYTDLEKGILYCDRQGNVKTISVVGTMGKRMDHLIANFGFLKQYYKENRTLSILTSEYCLEYVKSGIYKIHGKTGDTCAIFGMPACTVTTQGLTWNMNNDRLEFGVKGSFCNQLMENEADIEITGEAFLVKPTSI